MSKPSVSRLTSRNHRVLLSRAGSAGLAHPLTAPAVSPAAYWSTKNEYAAFGRSTGKVQTHFVFGRESEIASASHWGVVTMMPVADLDSLSPAGEDLKRADYLVYTIK